MTALTERERDLCEEIGRAEALLARLPAGGREEASNDLLRGLMVASRVIDNLIEGGGGLDREAVALANSTRQRLRSNGLPTRWRHWSKRAYLVLVANGGASAVAVDEDKIEAAEACTSGYVAIEVGDTEYESAKDALARIMPEPAA